MKNLALRHVRKVYDNGFEAVADFNLSVDKGEFVAFLGPSGCGKSTILRMIAGFEPISGGEMLINGQRINDLAPSRRPTAMIFQNYALFPHMTVRANVGYGLDVRQLPKAQRNDKVDRMLDVLGLTEVAERRGSALSGGQRQRVAIARALVTEPEILLLDEPLGALDANLRKAIQNELKLLQKSLGITFIFVTHAQSEALALSDRIVVINSGKIEQVGRPHTIYTRPDSAFVARFIGRNALFPGVVSQRSDGGWCVSDGTVGLGGEPAGKLVDGANGLLVVPSEAFEILPEAAGHREGRNQMPGSVVSIHQIGALLRIRAKTDDGAHVQLDAPAAKYSQAALVPGQRITLDWLARDSTIVGGVSGSF